MKHSRTFFIGIALVATSSAMLFLWPSDTKKQESTDIETTLFERNISWGTEYLSSVPHQKGDEVEKLAIFKNSSIETKRVTFDAKPFFQDIEPVRVFTDSGAISDTVIIPGNTAVVVHFQGSAQSYEAQATIASGNTFQNWFHRVMRTKTVSPVTIQSIATVSDEPKKTDADTVIIDSWAIQLPVLTGTSSFNAGLDTIITIAVSAPENFRSLMIGEQAFVAHANNGKVVSFIPASSINPWQYFSALVDKNGWLQALNEPIIFKKNEAPVIISDIVPGKITNDIDRFIVLSGKGFSRVIGIQLSNNMILTKTDFTPITDNAIGIRIPRGIEPGSYRVNLMDKEWIYESEPSFSVIAK